MLNYAVKLTTAWRICSAKLIQLKLALQPACGLCTGVTVCGGGCCQCAGPLSMKTLLGFFHFLKTEEGSAERVSPGQLSQSGRIHGGVLPSGGAALE